MSDPSRVVCSRCGSNNFSTQASCWKCGGALAQVPPTSAAMPPTVSPATSGSTAFVAAVALGLLFPLIAVPVGIVFLMLDDPRKSAVGRWNIAWGIVGTIVHTIATGVLVQALAMPMLIKAFSTYQQQGSQADVDKAGELLRKP